MTPKLAEYIAEGRSLSADERELAAVALQQISDEEQADVDADEVHAQIRAKLAAMRK